MSAHLQHHDRPATAQPSVAARDRRARSIVRLGLGAAAVLGVMVMLGSSAAVVARGWSDGTGASGGGTEAGATSAPTTVIGATWPSASEGRPAVFGPRHDPITAVDPEAAAGVYVWHEFDGWHLWIVDPGGRRAARGTVASDQPIGDAQTAARGRGSIVVKGSTMTFDFSGVDAAAAGTTFDTGFFATGVTFTLQGTDLPLRLGRTAREATSPTVLTKQVPSR